MYWCIIRSSIYTKPTLKNKTYTDGFIEPINAPFRSLRCSIGFTFYGSTSTISAPTTAWWYRTHKSLPPGWRKKQARGENAYAPLARFVSASLHKGREAARAVSSLLNRRRTSYKCSHHISFNFIFAVDLDLESSGAIVLWNLHDVSVLLCVRSNIDRVSPPNFFIQPFIGHILLWG